MEINRDAPAVASSEIDVQAPPEVVWDVLTDFERWPEWNPDVKSLSIEGPVAPGTQFRWNTGPLRITSTLREVKRPWSIGWTGKAFGIGAVHMWRFEPRQGGTLVHTEESWEGPLPGLLPGRMQKALQQSFDNAMPHLKAEAERRAAASG
jgi:uncharacterized protein YndB with AHSA1/START domain